jgi:hypothetical protein
VAQHPADNNVDDDASTRVDAADSAPSSASVPSPGEPLRAPIGELIRARLRNGEGGRLGRYLILRLLGEGGMGLVFAAYDEDLDRKVAIKLLRTDGPAGPLDKNWLLAEAKAMARLSHPNVVQIYDVGELEGQIFVAMELVTGASLRDWLRQERRTIPEITRVFVEAGRGLAAVHRAGLVHRDFKPLSTPSPTRTPLSQQIGCNPTKSGVLAGVAFFPEGLRAPPVAQNQAKTRQNRAAR